MKTNVFLGLVLCVAVTGCLCRPAAKAPGGSHRPPNSLTRRDWPEPPTQEQQQQRLMSRFLPHVFAELSDRKGFVQGNGGMEALHEHFYPDWMDFGRRSTEDAADAA
ncbi:gastrin/cholecystokinin-like peptide [Coturnix japonica]|uniref:Gastrin/cholecystokinin-like peptide n=1 Tax=Coturnix japonica TaxID=93934 RepID=A0A8C2SX34_COTJA|nr:gastrin/cholecystokinin-like peptide [Coturnix japonica]